MTLFNVEQTQQVHAVGGLALCSLSPTLPTCLPRLCAAVPPWCDSVSEAQQTPNGQGSTGSESQERRIDCESRGPLCPESLWTHRLAACAMTTHLPTWAIPHDGEAVMRDATKRVGDISHLTQQGWKMTNRRCSFCWPLS